MSTYAIKWEKDAGLATGLHEMLGARELMDVTLSCEGENIQAHKVVLAACSPHFRQIFIENPCKHPVVVMQGLQVKHLKNLLNFLYSGVINMFEEDVSEFLATATVLGIGAFTYQPLEHSEPINALSAQYSKATEEPLIPNLNTNGIIPLQRNDCVSNRLELSPVVPNACQIPRNEFQDFKIEVDETVMNLGSEEPTEEENFVPDLLQAEATNNYPCDPLAGPSTEYINLEDSEQEDLPDPQFSQTDPLRNDYSANTILLDLLRKSPLSTTYNQEITLQNLPPTIPQRRKMYRCEECDVDYLTVGFLNRHMRIKHSNPNHDSSLDVAETYKTRPRRCKASVMYKCSEELICDACGKRFWTKRLITQHILKCYSLAENCYLENTSESILRLALLTPNTHDFVCNYNNTNNTYNT